jgi:hypothetical protein
VVCIPHDGNVGITGSLADRIFARIFQEQASHLEDAGLWKTKKGTDSQERREQRCLYEQLQREAFGGVDWIQ